MARGSDTAHDSDTARGSDTAPGSDTARGSGVLGIDRSDQRQEVPPNANVDLSNFEREPRSAVLAFYERAGFFRSVAAEIRDVESIRPARLCRAFEASMGGGQNMEYCAVCGVYDMQECKAVEGNHLETLMLTEEERKILSEMSRPASEALHITPLPNGDLVRVIRLRDGHVFGCDDCRKALSRNYSSSRREEDDNVRVAAPYRTLAATDWGCIPSTLPKLSLLERIAISMVVPMARIIKLTSGSGHVERLALRGHVICLPHSSSTSLSRMSALPRSNIPDHVSLVWIGTREVWQNATLRSSYLYERCSSLLRLDARVCLVWLRFLTEANPYYALWEDLEEV
ncbi:MAG: DUF6570 domain-containing protein, partial [Bacteroidota bacterium]